MKRKLFNRIKQMLGRSDGTAGFTLVEVIISAAAFTIICAGITLLLITALRIEKYTAENTNCRETVRMVKAFIKEQTASGVITQTSDGDGLAIDGATFIECVSDTEHPGKYLLQAGGVSVASGLDSVVDFRVTGRLVQFTISMNEEEPYPISIYCPMN